MTSRQEPLAAARIVRTYLLAYTILSHSSGYALTPGYDPDRCMFVSAKTQMTCNHVRAWISVEKRSSFCPAHMCRKIKCESSCDDMEFFCAKREYQNLSFITWSRAIC